MITLIGQLTKSTTLLRWSLCLLFISSGCSSTYSHRQNGEYITQQTIHNYLFNRFVEFDIAHKGGPLLDQCLNELDTLESPRIKVILKTPCQFRLRTLEILDLVVRTGCNLKCEIANKYMELAHYFDQFDFSKNEKYRITLLITPMGYTYLYSEKVIQFDVIKMIVGNSISMKNPELKKFLKSLIRTVTHELIHHFDLRENDYSTSEAPPAFQLEYIAYLSDYCATNYLDLTTNIQTTYFAEALTPKLLNTLEDRTYEEVKDYAKIITASEGKTTKTLANDTQLAKLFVQRDIFNLLGTESVSDINYEQREKINHFCKKTIDQYFSNQN